MAKQPLHELMIWSILACVVIFSPTSSEAFRFIVTGDTRGNDNGVNALILAEMAQAAIDEAVDFIVVTGDLVNGSSDPIVLESQLTTWRNTMQPLYELSKGVYPCRGNHDTGSNIQIIFLKFLVGIFRVPISFLKDSVFQCLDIVVNILT